MKARPFPPAWTGWLLRNAPYYRLLPGDDRLELHGHTHVLLAEKRFEGCGGLRLTDEMTVTIAAQAAVLLLHRRTDYYPRLKSVLVYPQAYVAEIRRPGPGGHVIEGTEVRLGESWYHGAVVLAWDEVLEAPAAAAEGRNVVFHEFAHQLDDENGEADGTPLLPDRAMAATWARVFQREYDRLGRADDEWAEPFLDEYGAENPAEFFAVVTEAFFTRPRELRREHPQVYSLLRRFYRQDPARLAG